MDNKQNLAWTGAKLILLGLGAVLVASIAAPLFKLVGIMLMAAGALAVLAGVMRRLVPFRSR